MAKEANHPVRTTEKSLALIERLREADGARIRDLVGVAELSKGAVHNHLSTLREHGYVTKEGEEYRLSLQFLTLGGYTRGRTPLYRYGRSKADQLAADTGMLTNLVTEENGRGVYLYQARGDYAVNLDTHVGYRIRLHYTGVGKAILAYLDPERVDEIVDEWGLPMETENTITDRGELHAELDRIRARGYATDHEERTEGLACIAAPIRLDDEILGAISISAPTQRLGNEGFDEEIVGEVESTANELALDLKYRYDG
ncbi:DNA-binding IclR family transcriptional regulator [Halarchaeum rubridurum]|uniref:IclR family transcriptional regulator n=1 Tax=Halarchaeum rubridurum TaxID=489911 RepID=A0A830FM96_9EURY|nr:IclR family transcriptional regulator [Halarchaeum rubridurum]MBP1954437.1 DNA-binding IclR family transcriptional regulator [Halarchaeum rubridurum]GGM60989.1 IclR family transcriptional regulator [Halarchaeum rubridurum]